MQNTNDRLSSYNYRVCVNSHSDSYKNIADEILSHAFISGAKINYVIGNKQELKLDFNSILELSDFVDTIRKVGYNAKMKFLVLKDNELVNKENIRDINGIDSQIIKYFFARYSHN